MRVVPGCFLLSDTVFVHIWPLNQAVFGLAVSLPENNCLASIRTSTGFPPMTEISGIPAYNPKTVVLSYWPGCTGVCRQVLGLSALSVPLLPKPGLRKRTIFSVFSILPIKALRLETA
ncbi:MULTISPECIES: hypothetical protein [Pseudomonas syringae group]|uniref:Uncharacterized protein n=1 Tax=Pseudomonas syringae pv. ribicola TaxID=55398 RepID=A0A3M2VUM4_PSESI|nr:hypothetical protein [Pseudomonas syringae group genomosp. 3]RML42952.1 hypothetical protein ALQ95_200103 [Pseudomonas syringae pv. ribicola]